MTGLNFRSSSDAATVNAMNWQVVEVFDQAAKEFADNSAFSDEQKTVIMGMLASIALALGTLYRTMPKHYHD